MLFALRFSFSDGFGGVWYVCVCVCVCVCKRFFSREEVEVGSHTSPRALLRISLGDRGDRDIDILDILSISQPPQPPGEIRSRALGA